MQQKFIKGIRYLPTLPTVLAQILALLNDERSSARDLESIITHDQALSSKVLTVANSAYYGFRHKILTVRRAVVALGYEEIRNVCLGASLMGFLHPSSFRDRQAAELLWLHSVCVADASSVAAEMVQGADRDVAFTAGLLHDLGKVVLAGFFPEEADRVRGLMDSERLSYRQAEKAQEADHAQIGKALCEYWDLPPRLAEAVGYHHDLHSGLVYFQDAALIHVADFLSRESQVGDSGNPDPPEVKTMVLGKLGLGEGGLKACAQEMDSRRAKVISLWQMLLKQP
jgi:putative nucleotidyltransferase with HDIG domain